MLQPPIIYKGATGYANTPLLLTRVHDKHNKLLYSDSRYSSDCVVYEH